MPGQVPGEDVAAPGPSATPEQVVKAYFDAIDARDFDTANTIDSRPGSDLGRFSRPRRADELRIGESSTNPVGTAYVAFTADFSGGDGSIEDGGWGYFLEQDGNGRWAHRRRGVG